MGTGIGRARGVLLALPLLLAAFPLPLSAKPQQFQVVVRLRHPDGTEEAVRASDFRFVYYDRRFIKRPTGFGKPGDLEIRDLPREVRSIQDEDLARVKFGKIRSVVLEYREEEGKRLLHLVMTLRSRHRKPVDWAGGYLRNANMSLLPHFRGVVDGKTVDFPLPPFQEPPEFRETVLTGIDFQAPGEGKGP